MDGHEEAVYAGATMGDVCACAPVVVIIVRSHPPNSVERAHTLMSSCASVPYLRQ